MGESRALVLARGGGPYERVGQEPIGLGVPEGVIAAVVLEDDAEKAAARRMASSIWSAGSRAVISAMGFHRVLNVVGPQVKHSS